LNQIVDVALEVCKIYIIRNTVNEKVYVGQTWQDLQARFGDHCRRMRGKYKISNAIRKHGKESFSIEAIASCTSQHNADLVEDLLIVEFDSIRSGYNIRRGGSRGRHSKETRAKTSRSLMGHSVSDEARRKMSISKIGKPGRPCPEWLKVQLSEQRRGKQMCPMTDEIRAKIGSASRGRKHSDESRAKMSLVQRKFSDDQMRQVLSSPDEPVKRIARRLGLDRKTVKAIRSGKYGT
jgi:group I intron endonuclease